MKFPLSFLFTKDAPPDCVPNRTLFAYATGLGGQNMTYNYISSWLFVFCNDILHISPMQTGLITSISRFFDAINDPVVGGILDRRRCRSGEKFRPYLLKLPPVIGILSALMFFDLGLSPTWAIFYILALYLLWDILYSVQDVALWSMVSISSPHTHERSRVAQWASIGAGLGSGFAGLFASIKGENFLNMFGISERTMYAIGGVAIAFVGELISMSAYKMPERVSVPKPEENILQSIGMIRHNKTLILISLGRFLSFVALSVPQVHFFESSVTGLPVDGGTAMVLWGLLTMIPGSLFALSCVRVADKLGGMKRMLLVTESFNILMRILCYFVGFRSLPQIITVMALMSIGNIASGVRDIAFRSMTGDSIDYVEWKTGKRTEGISFSVQNLISKLGGAVTLYINGFLLTRLGYNETQKKYNQNPTYMKWQWPMFILGPIVGLVLYLIVILFIDDDKQKKEMIEAELRERRLAGQKERMAAT